MRAVACGLCVGLMALAGCAQQPSDPGAEAAAVAAAERWLGMIDSKKYGESWDDAAAMFRKAVPRDQWQRQLEALREPMGALQTRQVASKAYRTALPGAPDGKYVVIQFRASFEKKKSAVETVTPMLDADGQWRVSGYFIK
ncbi:MAG: DUF4019 domain-containing protein [Verrucomicrobiae bacterium]|nr:DUF4019 domain-containing protein [Verrucomicrobiae bacterium]